ncbi:response regulator [Wenyingzhuangia sp. IMCC45467]
MQDVKNNEPSTFVKKLKILIAEDDEVSNFLLTYLLKEKKPELLRAKTGIEAVDICTKNPDIDIILMDINMPEMNGYDATKQIREFNKDIIIIVQTSKSHSKDNELAITAGCNDFLTKPIRKDLLFSTIQKYFN